MKALESNAGQAATEYMLLISVVVLAVVAATTPFVPIAANGVHDLAPAVQELLQMNRVNVAYDPMNSQAGRDSRKSPPPPKPKGGLRAASVFIPSDEIDGGLILLTHHPFPVSVPMSCAGGSENC